MIGSTTRMGHREEGDETATDFWAMLEPRSVIWKKRSMVDEDAVADGDATVFFLCSRANRAF